ncbi:MAG: dihydrofolate reductase [Bdellovibrionales bacterium]|nr:dihydrofolate reductase [Bdellovibrionales bacterium]
MSLKVKAIVAMDEGRAIGLNNDLLWHIPEDMKRFKELTSGDAVLMGRKTYESLPEKFRPLPNRKNIICTRDVSRWQDEAGVDIANNSLDYIEKAKRGECELESDSLWIIGGAQIYKETLPLWDELFLTLVHKKHDGDAFFPEFESEFELVSEEAHEGFSFLHYTKK